MKKIFQFFVNAAAAVKATIFLALVTVVIYVGYLLYNMFSITDVKTETFAMNEWQLLKAQKLVITEIDGKATGRYGYRTVVHTTMFGERHDTLPWWAPGSKYVDINGPVSVTVGYDMVKGDQLFSENAIGEIRETEDSVILRVITDLPVPSVMGNSIRNIPNVSSSFFTGGISDEEFFSYADSIIEMTAQSIIQNEQEFFMGAYSEALIGILSQTLAVIAKGKNIKISLFINGRPYIPDGYRKKKLDAIEFPVGKTISIQ